MVFFFLKLIKRPAFWLGCAFIVPCLRDAPELITGVDGYLNGIDSRTIMCVIDTPGEV